MFATHRVVILVALLVVGLLVFVIAAVAIGREARRLDETTPQPTFTVEEAVEWVALHLPSDVTAQLSYDDVRLIIEWSVDFLRSRGVYVNGSGSRPVEDVVTVGGAETAEYVLERAEQAGFAITAEQVHAILLAELSYFEAIGAIGPIAPDKTPD